MASDDDQASYDAPGDEQGEPDAQAAPPEIKPAMSEDEIRAASVPIDVPMEAPAPTTKPIQYAKGIAKEPWVAPPGAMLAGKPL